MSDVELPCEHCGRLLGPAEECTELACMALRGDPVARAVYGDDYDDGYVTCDVCHGSGSVITCPDDMCATSDTCMHGDGEEVCSECGGEGDVLALAPSIRSGARS